MDPAQGGPPVVALRIASALAQQGNNVQLVSYAMNDAKPDVLEKVNKEFDTLGLGKNNWIQLEGKVGRDMKRLCRIIQHADFVHIHGVWNMLTLRAAKIARNKNVPYSVTPHGMLDPWCLEQKAIKKKLALLLGFRKMLNGAAFLHVLNKDEGDLMRPLNLTSKPITIPNGVFLNEIDPLPPKGLFRQKYSDIGNKPFVLFLSRLHYKKGLDYLAESFQYAKDIYPDTWLVVAGPDGGSKDAFQRQIKELGIADQVLLTGPIYGDEKYHALIDASCFCLPSRQEGFSIAITEALACSRPVVISQNCHFPEVEQAEAGYVCQLSVESLGKSLVAILEDTTKSELMGKNGRALIEERYTWPRIAERCLEAYKGLI